MLPFTDITSGWFLDAFGKPTPVQEAAWPQIAAGADTLVSAPTGTGKTLSAFLVFIDKLSELARRGELKPELYLIYVSPLKSLVGDIRENLRKPLFGISRREHAAHGNPKYAAGADRLADVGADHAAFDNQQYAAGADQIAIGVRTGDTTAGDRRAMFKNPPHILITTPESLYILLTSVSGIRMLRTAGAVIIDELHAMIGSKRGAHLMFSVARLDELHKGPLQRIGLSATIEPLDVAAGFLSPGGAAIVAPKSVKLIELTVKSAMPKTGVLPKGTIWPEIAREVYDACARTRCVIAFVESRMHAEKLAYHVNQIAGEGFALTHHGSVSKERRFEAEQALREGRLRLLCATSSMELGIDVGDIDLVIQIGCPRTVSSTLQRLGRAGHNPGRVSVMRIFPRTPAEGISCGITAELARNGVIEPASPPRICLDVLAQHLVSMAAAGEYTVDDIMRVCARAYPFSEVARDRVESVLRMLAGDYEHGQDVPARPRLLYDRINGRARGDAYSRLLALSAGGTIPDKGQFAVRGENGVRYGEVDEEFVFEARVGDRFLLGAFAWRILSIGRDEVVVAQSGVEGVQPPFWKGEFAVRGENGVRYGEVDEEFVFEARVGDRFLLGAFAWRILSIGRDEVVVAQSGVEGVQPPFWKGEVGGRSLHTGLAYGKLLGELSEAARAVYEEGGSSIGAAPDAASFSTSAHYIAPIPASVADAAPASATHAISNSGVISGVREGLYLYDDDRIPDALDRVLCRLGLDMVAADAAKSLLIRQIEATGALPDDKTIIVEHFQNEVADSQLVVHSVFGRRINSPLALLARESARHMLGADVGVYDDDDGFLLFPVGGKAVPEGLLYALTNDRLSVTRTLDALLPATPLFSMAFRYNAARALMMGVRKRGRQPLWIQRQRGAKLLDRFFGESGHPLIEETKRECLEQYWDVPGLEYVLDSIRSGAIAVREIFTDRPSPLSLPLRRAVEADLMYEYSPTPPAVGDLTREAISAVIRDGKAAAISPGRDELKEAASRDRKPADIHALHSLLMTEGDQIAGEADAPVEWFEALAAQGRARYIEPGLWIAAEHAGEYAAAYHGIYPYAHPPDALQDAPPDAHGAPDAPPSTPPGMTDTPDAPHTAPPPAPPPAQEVPPHMPDAARRHIARRALRYHGGHSLDDITGRYCWPPDVADEALAGLLAGGEAVREDGVYYHAGLYEIARRKTMLSKRAMIKTQPPERYAALLAGRAGHDAGTPAERVLAALLSLCGQPHPAALWESVLLPGRVPGYRPEALDAALARGEVFWKIGEDMSLAFYRIVDIDPPFTPGAGENIESDSGGQTEQNSGRQTKQNSGGLADLDSGEHTELDAYEYIELDSDERIVLDALEKRGALFTRGLESALGGKSPYDALISLVGKGLIRSDGFTPVRHLLEKDSLDKANVKRRAQARVQMLTGGRWELARGAASPGMEAQLTQAFDQSLLLCRETAPPQLSWPKALELLRVWEYTGLVRRGYYVEGLSGAQFVRERDFAFVTAALARTDMPVAWLPAADPAQPWGKSLPHLPGRSFMNLPGTAVCLIGGTPSIVFERQGQILRYLGGTPDGAKLAEALKSFASLYSRRRLFCTRSNITIKQYPPDAAEPLSAAGFSRHIQDYVIYRNL